MSKKRALIFGITGQDGSYLAEHLLELDYEVFGTVRRNSVPESQSSRIDHLSGLITTSYGDLSDCSSIENAIKESRPDEIYNLAAQSHVGISAKIPQFTVQTNGIGVCNILEAYRNYAPNAKFYQASSSEMFGNKVDEDGFQRETTPMEPVSVYGCTKLFGFNLVKFYRRAYNLFACNGILFNHESPRRGSNFVTSKVVKTAVEISLGISDKLVLGNLDSYRDWGHSYDYVRAMKLIIDQPGPDDFVISTGQTHSVREMCEYVFNRLNMDYRDYVEINQSFFRAEELRYLKGDSSKAREILGWKPKYTFETMLDDMIFHWQNQLVVKI